MTEYKCVKPLVLDKHGDDGFPIENECFAVEVDSVWEQSENPYRFAASSDSIRLENDISGWIEIHQENLDEHFIKI